MVWELPNELSSATPLERFSVAFWHISKSWVSLQWCVFLDTSDGQLWLFLFRRHDCMQKFLMKTKALDLIWPKHMCFLLLRRYLLCCAWDSTCTHSRQKSLICIYGETHARRSVWAGPGFLTWPGSLHQTDSWAFWRRRRTEQISWLSVFPYFPEKLHKTLLLSPNGDRQFCCLLSFAHEMLMGIIFLGWPGFW